MKLLLLDIETSPLTAHVWGLFDQNIGLNQILDTGKVLCWSAKWYGKAQVYFDSTHKSDHKTMLQGIYNLLQEADAVIHYNGTKFDIPVLNKEFLLHGFSPPAPYKQIDLLRVARRQFRFPSNRLDYVAAALGLGKKRKTDHQLWIDCMNDVPKAWKEMEAYNKHDVVLLEGVYVKILPWIKGHANHNLYGKTLVCPNCGGNHYQRRGTATTIALRYPRYQCTDCGTWFRGTPSQGPKPKEKFYSI